MSGVIQDLGCALRQLKKSPAFSAAAVLTLALGIVGNSAIVGVIEAVMLRPLPYRNPHQLVWLVDRENPGAGGLLLRDISGLQSDTRSFTDITFYYRDKGFSQVTLTGGEPESSIARRTQEIGMREALGARREDILRLVLCEAMKFALTGIAIGCALGFVLTGYMSTLLFGVRPIDPVTFVGAPILLVMVALLATVIPGWRATKVDPMSTLVVNEGQE